MKKVMLGLAIVAFAMTASATKVTWGLTDGSGFEAFDSGTMYLCYASAGVDWSQIENAASFSADSLAAVGFTKQIATKAYAEGASTTTTITPSSLGASGTQTFYTVVIADDGKTLEYASYTAAISTATSTLPKRVSAENFTQMLAKSGPEPTPEPTSALLLVLGMAGLALRRRRS